MAAAVVLLAACTSNDEERVGKSMPIRLAIAVDESAQTRAGSNVQNTELLSGEAVDVYIKNASTSDWIANPLSCTVSGNSGDLTSASTLYYPYDGSSVNMYAVHPSVASGATFTVDADQTSDANYAQSDLTFSKAATYTYSTAVQTLPMTHLMAKVIVNISVPATLGTGTLTNQKLHAKRSTVVTYPVDNSDGYTLSAASGDGEISFSVGGAVLIPPQTITSGSAFISFNIPGVGPYVYRLPADRTFEAGKQYVYNLTPSSNSLSYEETSVSQPFSSNKFTNPLTNTGSGQVVYTSSNTAVATVNTITGEVTLVAVGTTTITASVAEGQNNDYSTKSASYVLTIEKSAPSYTAPTAKTGLTYNGSAQQLINAGSTSEGTMYYSKDGSSWTANAASITETNAKTSYTVYYKVTGDGNHTDVASQSLTVPIAKATATITIPTGTLTVKNTNDVYATFSVSLSSYDSSSKVTVSSGNTSYYTVSASALSSGTSTITVADKAVGTATLTVSATSDNYTYANVQRSVTVQDPGIAMSSVTTSNVSAGNIIAQNSKVYKNKNLANRYSTGAALIFGVGTSASGNSSYKRGIAISLANATSSRVVWKSDNTGYCTVHSSVFSTAKSYMDGVSYTATLVGHSGHGHAAATAANSYTPTISGAKWFLPSLGQWCAFFNWCNGGTVVNSAWGWNNNTTSYQNIVNKMSAAGGASVVNIYWTSIEYGDYDAVYVSIGSSGTDMNSRWRTEGCVVRAFLAF